MKVKITEAVIKKELCTRAGVVGAKPRIVFDTDITGFGVRFIGTDTAAFILDYRIKQRQRRYTIGKFGDWKVTAAREEAKLLRQEIDRGRDIMGERHAVRESPTVRDLCDEFEAKHLIRKRDETQRAYKRIIRNDIIPAFGKKKASEVTYADVHALHSKITERSPYTANRCVDILRKMFNEAIKWKYLTENPAKSIERNDEEKRERYLTADEMNRLAAALNEYAVITTKSGEQIVDRRREQSANVIRLLVFTGARKGEVLNATWNQFDLNIGVWTKPSAHTKQKKIHRVPLSEAAKQLLIEIRDNRASSNSALVFPSVTNPEQPQTELKKAWAVICAKAKIENLRIHDLRHSFASFLASSGYSLPIIGALLGHTQVQTTARYAHLLDNPLRDAAEKIGALVRGEK